MVTFVSHLDDILFEKSILLHFGYAAVVYPAAIKVTHVERPSNISPKYGDRSSRGAHRSASSCRAGGEGW